MGQLRKISNLRSPLPAKTFNELVDDVRSRRLEPSTIDDTRRPQSKSPVIVQLVWDGEDAIESGSVVKLGSSLLDPTTDSSAPFAGLKFYCGPFDALDPLSKFALTMGPIEGGGDRTGFGVIPEAYWAQVDISNADHTVAKIIAGGTVLDSSDTDGLPIFWKPGGTGVKWCIVCLQQTSITTNASPLKEFELTADKSNASATATAKWLDHAGDMVGDAVTLHDPDERFAGKTASYVGSERGFRGLALLRADLAEEDPNEPRWEIIAMERFAEWAIVEWDSSNEEWDLVSNAFGGDEWNNRRPAANGAALAVNDTAALIGRTPADGETAVVRLTADTDTPTYQIHGVRNEDRRVAISSGDTVPLELLSKVVSGGVYDSGTDEIAKVDEIEDGGIKKLRIAYTPNGSAFDKGTVIATGFVSDYVDPTDTTFTITTTFTFDGIGIGSLPDPLTVQNEKGKAYEAGVRAYAAHNALLDEWEDITPTEGEIINAVVEENIPAATWDEPTRTLTPGEFTAIWMHRDPTLTSPDLIETLTPITIVADNCSRKGIAVPSESVLFVKLRWESGAWSLIWDERGVRPATAGEDGAVEIKSVDTVETTFVSEGELEVKINYKKYLVFATYVEDGDTSDTLTIWAKTSPGSDPVEVVTSVACVSDEVTGTTDEIGIPTLPSEILVPPA
jgi:hypothetical protein